MMQWYGECIESMFERKVAVKLQANTKERY